MFEVIESSPSEFQSKFEACEKRAAEQGMKLLLLFSGEVSIETGKSWCPDCTAADPIIEEALSSSSENFILLKCPVDRATYKARDHYYQKLPLVSLTCVPTLLKVSNGKCIARLNDSQCQVLENIIDLATM
jgi:thiol-disulfide isomerase/thioredoxin